MARHQITAEQAYTLLQEQSQHTNAKLRDVAPHYIALTGTAATTPADHQPPGRQQIATPRRLTPAHLKLINGKSDSARRRAGVGRGLVACCDR